MNETWAQVLLGLCCTAIFGIVGSGTVCIVIGNGRLSRIEATVEFLVESTGRMAAKKLHSPDNHLGIDHYLDMYINHHHDLSMEEWTDLKEALLITRMNELASKTEKIYAEFLIEICEHKLMAFGKSTHTKNLIK